MIANYISKGSVEWVTSAVCSELQKKFGVRAEVKRGDGGNGCSGTLKGFHESADKLNETKQFLRTHYLFSNHFNPTG